MADVTYEPLTECTDYDLKLLDRILAKTIEQGDCLLWTGMKQHDTPMVSVRGRNKPVRQTLVKLLVDYHKVPPRIVAGCGNKNCVAPEHNKLYRGEAHIREMRVLSPEQVKYVRETPAYRGVTIALARELKVPQSLISQIRTGVRYQEVDHGTLL